MSYSARLSRHGICWYARPLRTPGSSKYTLGGTPMIAEPASETSSAWQLDPVHSLVEFSAKHLMVTTVKGRFKGVQGTIIVDEAGPAGPSVGGGVDGAGRRR